VYIGVNSVTLAQLAGRRADGVNVRWHHPARDELLAAVGAAFKASGRVDGFALTTWTGWDDALLDPEHEQRRAMAERGIDRLVLAELGTVRPDHVAVARPR
jgi:hypothetical protein